MGSWGYGPFDDDSALEWVLELEEATDWSVVESALRTAADTPLDVYLQPPDAQVAWAAASVVAAVEEADAALPDRVASWLREHRETRPPELRPLAVDALQRILAGKEQRPDQHGMRALIESLR